MQFESMSEFIAMNGHGVYIWSAYFIAFVALTSVILMIRQEKRGVITKLKRFYRRQQKQAVNSKESTPNELSEES